MAKKVTVDIYEQDVDSQHNAVTSNSDDFDFSSFYEDEEGESDSNKGDEELGIHYDEEEYDELIKLDNDVVDIAIDATYPYIRIKGFLIKDEIVFMRSILEEYSKSIEGKYQDSDLLNVAMEINGENYNVVKLPLILDTFLTIFKAHRYDVSIVRGPGVESYVTSDLMKAFLFT